MIFHTISLLSLITFHRSALCLIELYFVHIQWLYFSFLLLFLLLFFSLLLIYFSIFCLQCCFWYHTDTFFRSIFLRVFACCIFVHDLIIIMPYCENDAIIAALDIEFHMDFFSIFYSSEIYNRIKMKMAWNCWST